MQVQVWMRRPAAAGEAAVLSFLEVVQRASGIRRSGEGPRTGLNSRCRRGRRGPSPFI
jgi:hypothetical protein